MMKRISYYSFVIAIVLGAIFTGPELLQAQEWLMFGTKIHPFKSAIVEYTVEGFGGEGTKELYIDDHGANRSVITHQKMTFLGETTVANTMMIFAEGIVYQIDLDKKTGTKPSPEFARRFMEMHPELKQEIKVEKIGAEIILGRRCEVYRMPAFTIEKYWVWQNLILKHVSEASGKVILKEVATELKINVPIPKEKFQVPKGVKIQELGGMLK